MSPATHGRPGAGGGRRRGRFRTVLGIPIPLVLGALLLSTLLGILLSGALESATTGRGENGSTIDSSSGVGNNAPGHPVVTESSVGTEVQELFDTGAIQPTSSFDAVECLREQGSTDAVQIVEEVAWGPDQTPAWLLVHGPEDPTRLREDGGTVAAMVVLPGCGSGEVEDPTRTLLWSGTVLLGT